MTTETLDKLYLEWSQLTTARTARELKYEAALLAAREAINPPDRHGISLDIWNQRLKAATATINEALVAE